MDDQLHRHFEDIFQLLDDIASCMADINSAPVTGTPANAIPTRIETIKEHIAEASKFLTA